MSKYEIGILVVGGLTGWWVISYLFDRKGGKAATRDEPPDESPRDPLPSREVLPPPPANDPPSERRSEYGPNPARAAASSESAGLSVFELQDRWPALLGVDREASIDEIESAYARRRAAIDRVRFSDRPPAEREAAARELRTLEAAYEFVRSARS